jgi:phospholipase/carboxylesterase
MSWSLGLGAGRPRPAGIIGLSGFMPTVPGFELDLGGLEGYPVAIGHGTHDQVIGVEWGRQARDRLEAAGADVTYRESPIGHSVDPRFVQELSVWLGGVV